MSVGMLVVVAPVAATMMGWGLRKAFKVDPILSAIIAAVAFVAYIALANEANTPGFIAWIMSGAEGFTYHPAMRALGFALLGAVIGGYYGAKERGTPKK